MGSIHVLDPQTANLIAAGEVVDRPASVVKELLENAIDSGADSIRVEIKNGGNALIRVQDNGCGMSREDAALCVKRHATSKIRSQDDLYSIATLGFRGEALAAISSVSLFSIVTKRAQDPVGTKFEIEGDEVLYYDDYGCPDGTTVTVTQIFKNQPARQKFLKRDQTEAASVLQYVQRIAISHPEISFTFLSNGETKLQTVGNGNLEQAIYSVYGKEFSSALTPVEYTGEQGLKVSGFVTRPDASRSNRAFQSFYINRRYVKSKTMLFALEDAYKSYMKSDRFPGCVLNLHIDFSKVDVNVHPAKLEVRFSDERSVYNAVYFAVKNALKSELSPLVQPQRSAPFPSVERFVKQREEKNVQLEFTPAIQKIQPYKSNTPPTVRVASPGKEEVKERLQTGQLYPEEAKLAQEFLDTSPQQPTPWSAPKVHTEITPKPVEQSPVQPVPPPSFVKNLPEDEHQEVPFGSDGMFIGACFEAFLLYQWQDQLYIIDKHAAHERLLYEDLKQQHEDNSVQMLIEPISVTLTTQQKATVEENREALEQAGFIVEPFGINEYVLRGVPLCLSRFSNKDIAQIFESSAEDLTNGGRAGAKKEQAKDRILYSMACKAAMKAGIKDSPADCKNLITLLANKKNIVVCPHGRPIVTQISKQQLERMFLRN